MEARAARFDEEDQLKKLRTTKVQERNAKLAATTTSQQRFKEPACWTMCPEFEMIDRQVTNDVSLFEAQIPFNPPQGKLIIDPKRAVKKFRRSAAGNYELSEDLRPPQVLLACTVYLMRDVLGDSLWMTNGVPFAVIYGFIRDRLRAIRTDLTLQNCKNLSSIRIHELSIRFLIAASHLLCEEERAAFEPQQNNEQLNGCLSALREMYKAVRLTPIQQQADIKNLLRNEPEFQAYSIILSVDKKEAAVVIASLPIDLLQDQAIQVVLEAYSSFQHNNYIKFLNIITQDPRCTYLQACLLHQFVLPIRQRAFNALIALPDGPFRLISRDKLARWLCFVDQAELAYYSDRFGFTVKEEDATCDLSRLIQRGEAYDLRAEEETFKFRKFQFHIEEQRRRGRQLSDLMFGEAVDEDMNYERVMKVLRDGPPHGIRQNALTSEFLAASTSSPIIKIDTKKLEPFYKANVMDNTTPHITPSTIIEAAPSVPPPPVIDHQALLRKRLHEQAQEKQARREKIGCLSDGLLEALIDSIVGGHVAELCTQVWESLCLEQRMSKASLIQAASAYIFNDLMDSSILPSVLDVELMMMRCRAANSLSYKSTSIHHSTFNILNTLETEICQEIIEESLLLAKVKKFCLSLYFKRLRRKLFKIEMLEGESRDRELLVEFPTHLVFACREEHSNIISSLLEPLMARHKNPLGYLQSFLNPSSSINMKMIFSDPRVPPFIASFLVGPQCCLAKWPLNYPGPTILIAPIGFEVVDLAEFPWLPKIINFPIENLESNSLGKVTQASRKLDEILSHSFEQAPMVTLPVLNQNIKVSDFISLEFINSFVFEPFEKLQVADNAGGGGCCLLSNLLRGLLERIVLILFKGPQATRLLSWHPITAGRSLILDSIRKSSGIPDKFVTLFTVNKSIESTLISLDQIYGSVFTCNLESLYTTHSISEIVRGQNDVINQFLNNNSNSNDLNTLQSNTIDDLKEKLKTETFESEAYEKFLKKFL